MTPCIACAAGNAKQNNVKKIPVEEPVEDGCLCGYLYIATLRKNAGMPGSTTPNWRIIVVYTKVQLKFSHFFVTKDGMFEPTCKLLHKWEQHIMGLTHMRMDNAGENKLFEQRCKSKDLKFNIVFEYTARLDFMPS